MELSNLTQLHALLDSAPENIRAYLISLFWILVVLLLIYAILKMLFSGPFKQFYTVLGTGAKAAGRVGKIVAAEAAKNIQLPEPYPRVARFFDIVFMLNNYALAFIFACYFLFIALFAALSNTGSFWVRTGALLFSVLVLYFAAHVFADAERLRVKLSKRVGS